MGISVATYNGIPIEWRPPCDPGEDESYFVTRHKIEEMNRRLEGTGWQWVQTGQLGGRPVYEMKKEVTPIDDN